MDDAERWLRRLGCRLLGHSTQRKGWWGDDLYGEVAGGSRDGTGRSHFQIQKPCHRCGSRVIIARFHGQYVTTILKGQTDAG